MFSRNTRAERRTRKVGSGIEFADHRTYTRGDDFRYIDWNLYGRLDKLLLRLFEEEEDLHIYILVDVSDSMSIGSPLPKLHYAMQVGAALTYVGLANLDRVSIVPFSDRLIDRLPLSRGKNRIFRVFDFLRNCDLGGKTELAECMKDFVTQTKRRGLAVVISDFYDPKGFEQGINTLRYKFEPFILQVYDLREASPTTTCSSRARCSSTTTSTRSRSSRPSTPPDPGVADGMDVVIFDDVTPDVLRRRRRA